MKSTYCTFIWPKWPCIFCVSDAEMNQKKVTIGYQRTFHDNQPRWQQNKMLFNWNGKWGIFRIADATVKIMLWHCCTCVWSTLDKNSLSHDCIWFIRPNKIQNMDFSSTGRHSSTYISIVILRITCANHAQFVRANSQLINIIHTTRHTQKKAYRYGHGCCNHILHVILRMCVSLTASQWNRLRI